MSFTDAEIKLMTEAARRARHREGDLAVISPITPELSAIMAALPAEYLEPGEDPDPRPDYDTVYLPRLGCRFPAKDFIEWRAGHDRVPREVS